MIAITEKKHALEALILYSPVRTKSPMRMTKTRLRPPQKSRIMKCPMTKTVRAASDKMKTGRMRIANSVGGRSTWYVSMTAN